MPGGLLSILSYGCNDLYLTGAPQITFFKIVYRRHTNFSIESIEVGYNNGSNFNNEYEIIVPRIGDLISKTYLKIVLPQVAFTKDKLGAKISSIIPVDNQKYNIVKNFMIFNIQAFRNVSKDINIKNITSRQIIIDINKCFSATANSITATSALSAYNILTNANIDNSEIYNMLSLSNIYNIIMPYLNTGGVILNINIKPSEIFTLVENAVNMSIKCQHYFWNEYNQQITKNNLDETNNLKFAWNENVGYNLIEHIDITLGGEIIDRIHGEFLEVYSQLTDTITMKNIHSSLIGNLDILTTYDKNPKSNSESINIPLKCWFTNNIGSAFPLISSQYSDLIIKIKFRSINQCGYVENINGQIDIYGNPIQYSLEDLWNDNGYRFECSLLIDYIYLDGLERRKFAQSAHEYLIETVQTVREDLTNPEFKLKASNNTLFYDSVMNNLIDYSIQLDLKHPCKELIWIIQKKIYTENKDGLLRCFFNKYGLNINSNENPISDGTITLNGYTKINRKVGIDKYYNVLQPYQHHTSTPKSGVFVYSFSIAPEDIQPSGSCNFSRFVSQQLIQKIKEQTFYYALSDIDPNIIINSSQDKLQYTDIEVIVFARGYNVIRIQGGFSGLAFSFN